MKIFFIIIGIILVSICSCSKKGNEPSNSITGTWSFKTQSGATFTYPSILTNPQPVALSHSTVSDNSIKINFNNGNYTFLNHQLPADYGSYTIVQDSMLIIQPDSSKFVAFCYTANFITASSTTVPTPYMPFHYYGDTIIFKKLTNDSLIFKAYWSNKYSMPIQPSQDTILLNQAYSYFKKL